MERGTARTTEPPARPRGFLHALFRPLFRPLFHRLLRCDGAAISPMFALLLVPLAGSIAFAVELGGFHYVQRSMQNAADAAALAAASNNSATGTTYLMEARAAARPYGYVNGTDNATVTAAKLASCPTGAPAGSTCYEAVITSVFPLAFSRLIGFDGDTVLGSGRGQLIGARAVATTKGGGGTIENCITALSSVGTPFQSNGGPKPNLSGCAIFSNGNMECSGHNLGASYGVAVGTNGPGNQCGNNAVPGATPITDPYTGRAANIPANTCPTLYPSGTYPVLPTKGSEPDLPARNVISGSKSWTGNQQFCGDVQLSGNVTLTGSQTTIVIQNGRLDLHGYKISTASGAAATIVFSGTNSSSYSHYPVTTNFPNGTKGPGPATIDITAPTSGVWSGVALYQDPALTTNVSFNEAGNSPAWNITGLAYFPKADIGFSGIVNKSATGKQCFVLVAYTVLISGTAQILANTECASAGLSPPTTTVGSSLREKLVY